MFIEEQNNKDSIVGMVYVWEKCHFDTADLKYCQGRYQLKLNH